MKVLQKTWIKILLLAAFGISLIASAYLDVATLWEKEVQLEELQEKETDYYESLIFKEMAVQWLEGSIEDLCKTKEFWLNFQEKTITIQDYAFEEGQPVLAEETNQTWGEIFANEGSGLMPYVFVEEENVESERTIINRWENMSEETQFVRIKGQDFQKLLDACPYQRFYSEEERAQFEVEAEEEDGYYHDESYFEESPEAVYEENVKERLTEYFLQCYDLEDTWNSYYDYVESFRLYKNGNDFLLYEETNQLLMGNKMEEIFLPVLEEAEYLYFPVHGTSPNWTGMLTGGVTNSLAEQVRSEIAYGEPVWGRYLHAVNIEKQGEPFIAYGEPDEEDFCVAITEPEELAYIFGKSSTVYKDQYQIRLYYSEDYFQAPEYYVLSFLYKDCVEHGDRTAMAVGVSVLTLLLGLLLAISVIPALWKREKEKLRDRVLLEVNLLFTFLVVAASVSMLYGIILFSGNMLYFFPTGGVLLGGAIAFEVVTLLGLWAVYQLVSTFIYRIRKRQFMRGWLAGRLFCWLYRKLKRVMAHMEILKRRILCLVAIWVGSFIVMLVICVCAGAYYEFIGVFGMFCYFVFMIGFSTLFLKDAVDNRCLLDGCNRMKGGMFDQKIETKNLYFDKLDLAEAINTMGEGLEKAVSTSMKDERMKTELITNVSHDIKTPLTSIINYVDLLKREDTTPEEQKEYIKVLDTKSQRLKQLIEDLIEVSKTSTGNIELQMAKLDFKELLNQAIGEFQEKFAERSLELVVTCAEHKIQIWADGRRCYRILENLFSNVFKYAMPNTRVYVDLQQEANQMVFTLKNISEAPLNVPVEELMERFVRGDESRSVSGSGLGLSIAQNLVNLQQGKLEIKLDGDLFKVEIRFPIVQ